MNNIKIKILTSLIKKKEYETYTKNEGLPLLRFDSQYLLNLNVYENFLQRFKANRVDVASFEELGTLRKGQEKSDGIKALGIMVKSISKLTIHPLKLELKSVSKNSLVKSQDLAIISTGIGSIGRSGIVPRYLINDLAKEIADYSLPFAVTQHIIKFEIESKDTSPYYIVALLNSYYGKLLIEGIATYGATGQLEVHVETLSRLKLPIMDIHKKVASIIESAVEDYEARAWKEYFKAMRTVEEYVGDVEKISSSVLKMRDLRSILRMRLDPSRLLVLSMILSLADRYRGKIFKVSDLFHIYTSGVPREKKYKTREGEYPLVTIDSIDESGVIDSENVYYISKMSVPQYPKGSLLLVKDGASIGKVGVLPYNAYVMQGIAVLIPKPNTDEHLKYYVFALLKTRLFKKIIESLGYGATVQYSITKDELESLPIPIIEEIYDEVSRNMEEFVENIYVSDELKKQAVAELERSILAFLS